MEVYIDLLKLDYNNPTIVSSAEVFFGFFIRDDPFFDSLKKDYPGFEDWYLRKAQNEEYAFVLYDKGVQGFLYLKEEKEEDKSITPIFEMKRRLKVGTFKINAHGTR